MLQCRSTTSTMKSEWHANLGKQPVSFPYESNEAFPDPDDRVFYEVALSKEGSYVVTGNLRHFPKTPIVVSPADMIKIVTDGE